MSPILYSAKISQADPSLLVKYIPRNPAVKSSRTFSGAGQAGLVENAFAEDTRSGLFRRLSITTKHYRHAQKWISSRKTTLRTLDALHLACCFGAGMEIVTCDEVLANSADVLGMPCRFVADREIK